MERKRHYRRLDQLRELLISHGVELLLESDPDDRDAVTFARVFSRVEAAGHARVTKGSVLGPGRAWASQRQFQQDVEAAAALAMGGNIDVELAATLEAASRVLETADLSTRAGRARVAQQLCRQAAEAYFNQLTESRSWRLWVGLWGRLAASGGIDDEGGLGTSLRQAQLGSLRRLVDQLYGPLAQVIGYRGRPEYGSDEAALAMMAVAAVGITDGLAIHERLFPEHFQPVARPTGPRGELEPWHPFAIAFEALVNQYLEPAPVRSGRSAAVPPGQAASTSPRAAAAAARKAAPPRKAAPAATRKAASAPAGKAAPPRKGASATSRKAAPAATRKAASATTRKAAGPATGRQASAAPPRASVRAAKATSGRKSAAGAAAKAGTRSGRSAGAAPKATTAARRRA